MRWWHVVLAVAVAALYAYGVWMHIGTREVHVPVQTWRPWGG